MYSKMYFMPSQQAFYHRCYEERKAVQAETKKKYKRFKCHGEM